MFETMPVAVSVYFISDECESTLRISADSTRYVDLQVIHEGASPFHNDPAHHTCAVYDFPGDGTSPKIQVQDRDTVIILAKKSDSLIATQVFEVDLSMAESSGYLLIPRGGYNIICDQESLTEDEFANLPQLSIHGPFEVGEVADIER